MLQHYPEEILFRRNKIEKKKNQVKGKQTSEAENPFSPAKVKTRFPGSDTVPSCIQPGKSELA